MTTEETPRAYTEEEVRDMIIAHVRHMAHYWATIPALDKATGHEHTVLDRCEGVAFSILAMLDGSSMNIPAITLKLDPHPDDKEYLKGEGLNWFEPGMEISDSLHEHFHKKERAA